MPYTSLRALPGGVQHVLPKHGEEIYLSAFNNAWEQYEDEAKRKTSTEPREVVAHKVAWAAVGHVYEKGADGKWIRKNRPPTDEVSEDTKPMPGDTRTDPKTNPGGNTPKMQDTSTPGDKKTHPNDPNKKQDDMNAPKMEHKPMPGDKKTHPTDPSKKSDGAGAPKMIKSQTPTVPSKEDETRKKGDLRMHPITKSEGKTSGGDKKRKDLEKTYVPDVEEETY